MPGIIKRLFSFCFKIALRVIDGITLLLKWIVSLIFIKTIFKSAKIIILPIAYQFYNLYLLLKQKIIGAKNDTSSAAYLHTKLNIFLRFFGFSIFLTIVITLSIYNFYTTANFSTDRFTQNILIDIIQTTDLEVDDNIQIVDVSLDDENSLAVNYIDTSESDNEVIAHIIDADGNTLTQKGWAYLQETKKDVTSYLVQGNDTLSSIAYKFGINLETLLVANNLKYGTRLKPGDKLVILPISGILYTIKKDDTLKKIASTYNSSVDELINFNKLINERDIIEGQNIIIPGGDIAVALAKQRNLSRTFVIRNPAYIYQEIKQLGFALLWPAISKKINQYFTWRHSGLDIHGKKGDPIYASKHGIVSQTGWARGYGYQVLIDHQSGIMTRYAHASKLLVKKNQHVKKGDIIALVGSTGRSTGPHIHYEVIKNGRRVNPLSYVVR